MDSGFGKYFTHFRFKLVLCTSKGWQVWNLVMWARWIPRTLMNKENHLAQPLDQGDRGKKGMFYLGYLL